MSSAPARSKAIATGERRTITLDLPAEQIQWLDDRSRGLMSRSAFARTLIAAAMQADATTGSAY